MLPFPRAAHVKLIYSLPLQPSNLPLPPGRQAQQDRVVSLGGGARSEGVSEPAAWVPSPHHHHIAVSFLADDWPPPDR